MFKEKINNSCGCREAQKDVDTINVQVTYDTDDYTDVLKANVPLLHNNRYTQVGFLGDWTFRVATRLQTNLYAEPTIGTSNVCLSCVALSITSTQPRSATGAQTDKTRSTRRITKRPVVTKA